MLRPATHIRYHITAILAVHWLQFVAQYKRWIRPEGLGYWNTGMMQDWDNRHVIYFLPIIPQFQHSTKIATDVWANQVLNALLDVPYHHLIMAIPLFPPGRRRYPTGRRPIVSEANKLDLLQGFLHQTQRGHRDGSPGCI